MYILFDNKIMFDGLDLHVLPNVIEAKNNNHN